MIRRMRTAANQTFSEEGRIALAIKLPRQIHLRMREMAIRQERRVNDLYQEVLEGALEKTFPGEPYLRGPPTNAQTVTLWLTPGFVARFKAALEERKLPVANVVLTALLEHFGEAELHKAS